VRALLASRKAILTKCVDLENELRGLLKVFGIRLPSRVGHGTFDAELRETVSSDEMLACALVPLLDARTVLYKTYLKLDNAVKALVRVDPVCHRLMSIPGIGLVTALTFKAAVDDPSRFKSSRPAAAHFGLTPRRFQSGEVDNPGHISRAGDADVRSTLYIAAHLSCRPGWPPATTPVHPHSPPYPACRRSTRTAAPPAPRPALRHRARHPGASRK